ncbi:MAG: DUF4058 family protein [Planctomycetes bacterium]|nr:DUF4058 family protein [Planctomycetota bacterium]
MDPYLEDPSLWPGFHDRVLGALDDWLSPRLLPRYYVEPAQRVYVFTHEDYTLMGVPDIAVIVNPGQPSRPRTSSSPAGGGRKGEAVLEVEVPVGHEVRETYLEIHESTTKQIVTLLELLSPANKLHPLGRADYLRKRQEVLASRPSLVEVDLLRSGRPMPLLGRPVQSDYRILVSRGAERPRAQLHAFGLRDPIPVFRLPLLPGQAELEVALGGILHGLYERLGYDVRIDCSRPPVPPLAARDAEWARRLIRAARRPPPVPSKRLSPPAKSKRPGQPVKSKRVGPSVASKRLASRTGRRKSRRASV